ncbi:MAG: galactose oxidase-like domain-containing protein [Steroidobacteraceae bacterium]
MTLTDIFCSNAVVLPENGAILIVGGDNWTGTTVTNTGNPNTVLFESAGQTLSRGNDMRRPRWYGTATTLMNGEVYVQGGLGGGDFPEVRDTSGNFRILSSAPTDEFNFYYPRNFLAPDGRVFGYDVVGRKYFVTPDGTGTIVRSPGNIVSTSVGKESTAAMFRPGKILQISGKTNGALVIDINGTAPTLTPTASLSSIRAWATATVLANGHVLVTGGSEVGNTLVNVNNSAEIWDPQSRTWSIGATGSRPRLFHSIALLLPDASVLVGGGGASPSAPMNNLDAEIYYPPYLFDASGGFASRPVIESAPDTLAAGQDFPVVVSSEDIDRVTLVQTGAATHSVNVQQRFIELSFDRNNNSLEVEMPDRVTDTPPGYYLMFVINNAGVPSRGKIVRVHQGSGGNPNPPPDTVKPSKPASPAITKVGGVPRLTWAASTDNVGVAGYAIHRSTAGTLGSEHALTTSTSFTDHEVIEGTRYTYGVKAYDAAGNLSNASLLRSVTVTKSNPTKPGSFSLNLVDKDPRLNFSASTDNIGVAGYNVYRSTDGTMGPLLAQIAGAPWVDMSAQKNVRYTYAVRARDISGNLGNPTPLKSITAK